jgi:hypothetical protein
MSTLKVTNIQATGETASRAVSGVAAAWMTMTGDGSAIDDSVNTSSLTDNGTGNFTQNYSNSFSNAHYSWCGQQESTYNASAVIIAHQHSAKTTSATLFYTYNTYAGVNLDTEENCTQVHGGLA